MKKITNWWTKQLVSGHVGALMALLAIISGGFFSLYPSEIKFSFRVLLSERFMSVESLWAVAFLSAGLLFVGLFSQREKYLASDTEQKRKEMMAFLRSMPPRSLLSSYSLMYRSLVKRADEALASKEIEQIAVTIRRALNAVANLLSTYADRPGAGVYSANIMMFIDSETASGHSELKETILRELRFTDHKSLVGLSGVLRLLTELSSSTKFSDEGAMDSDLKGICLPIPDSESDVRGKTRYIPGAPRAYKDSHGWVKDVSAMARLAQEQCDISPSVVEEIDRYVHQQASKRIGTIITMMLDLDMPQLGVVNIHSDEPGILPSEEVALQFMSLARPLIDQIRRLYTAYLEVGFENGQNDPDDSCNQEA